ncbi:hypothetical protein AAC387_Pa09g1406 [Persea americana]
MASSSLSTILFLFLFLFMSPSLADTSITPATACISTPDPTYCKSVLSSDGQTTLQNHGLFSIKQSLNYARKFAALVDSYLEHGSSFSQSTIRALEDCQLLSSLTADHLSNSINLLNSTDFDTDDVQTLLSAVITNQQTCLESLQESATGSTIQNNLSTALLNDTKLHKVSLALFTRAWPHSPKRHKRGRLRPGRKLFSDLGREISEFKSRRRLLQSSTVSDSVLVRDIVVVSKDGSGNFTAINSAVAAAPDHTNISDGYFVIYVQAGVYQEYVSVNKTKKNLMMIGDGINQTIITGNRNVVDGSTTFNSATFAVVGEGFVAINITFRNTAGAVKQQAVALRSGADFSTFYSCSFEGYQDTLYTHSLRQFYRDCDIYGTVDFIFGNAAVVFQNCNIYARLPISGQSNTITAQGRTDPNQNTGTSIHDCRVAAASDLVAANGSTKSYLGRPWQQYSMTVYMQSFIDSLIDPAGWLPWSGNFALSTLYYAEYNNTGPGSNTSKRVTWTGYHVINASSLASNFTVSNFISGDSWIPATGVPYVGGLL